MIMATKEDEKMLNTTTDIIVGENAPQAAPERDPYAGTRSYIQELIDASKQRNKDLERREKLSRAHEAVSSIADMGRALSNLYYTNEYSPNTFEDSGLSDKARQRWEQAKAEREKNRENIMNYHMMQDKLNDAERQWKYKQERDKMADKQYQDRLDAIERERKEKRKEAKVAANNLTRSKNWTAQMLNGEYDRQREMEGLNAMLTSGEIDAYEYSEAVKALDAAESDANMIKAKNQQAIDRYNSTTGTRRSGGGGGGKSNNNKYIAFYDGGGVTINKNDDTSITSIYDDADFPAEYKAKDQYGRVKGNPSAQDKRDAVENYLKNNSNERYEEWLRRAERRQTQSTSNGEKKKNPMNGGKKKNPMG